MTYGDCLRKRWAVVRLLPQMQRVDVGWFYHYSDADGYARILRRLDPAGKFEVVFDAPVGERQKGDEHSVKQSYRSLTVQ